MIVLATLWLNNYRELATLTCGNKSEYAERHGFKTWFKEVDGSRSISFEKITVILEAMEKFPECSWVW